MLPRPARLFLITLPPLVLLGSVLAFSDARPPESVSLDDLLARLAGVATLYRDSALNFACDEQITDSTPAGKSFRFEYVYAYAPSRGFKDYRTIPGSGSKREICLDAYGFPQFLRRAYSWAFIFGEAARKRHRYEIVGETTLSGRPAVELRFAPIRPYREDLNYWFGSAWVDRDTFQLLRVEAVRADQHEKEMEFEKELAIAPDKRAWGTGKRFLIEHVSTDFSVEKNGMRFPGQVVIALSQYVMTGRGTTERFHESPVYRVEQTYTNYRFFNVRTREEIMGIVMSRAAQDHR